MSDIPGALIGGRYRLQAVLGHGGMATVWRAVDERLDRPVAVKLLDRADTTDPTTEERFDREARTAAGLTHPNIVAVHDVDRDGDVPFLVMELVDGSSLAARLAGGPLPVDEAVRIAGQVCDVLAAAHAAGVVHRDIKPANILLAEDGTVKVCDFGIARAIDQQGTALTGPQVAIGTSQYMAPEQAGGGPVDAGTDLYALGCLLYAMLTGGPPFTGDSLLDVLWRQQRQPAPPVADRRPDTPGHLRTLVAALLAKHPADRPATADQVHQMLHGGGQTAPAFAARAAVPVISPTRTLPELDSGGAATPHGGRWRVGPAGVAGVAASAAVLAALAAGALLTTNQPDPEAGPSRGPAATATAASPTRAANQPTDRLAALRATIDEQARAGDLDARAAEELTGKLDDVDRELADGKLDKAADKVADLRKKLDDLRADGEVSGRAYDAVSASIDRLAGTLPAPKKGRKRRR